jgi:isopenicillin N synthase-like dioxygenase
MSAMARGLGLHEDFFKEFTKDPFTPFRIFHYPADPVGIDAADGKPRYGVQEHTDYGVLTILAVDDAGLEVKIRDTDAWVSVPLIPDTFVVNVGDMAELWTNGAYKATPHRVRNTTSKSRISLPFFFDPSWDAVVRPLLNTAAEGELATNQQEGDSNFSKGATVARTPSEAQKAVDDYRAGNRAIAIQYGPYILSKVLKVFPQLSDSGPSSTAGGSAQVYGTG